jgi:hypothetical protein
MFLSKCEDSFVAAPSGRRPLRCALTLALTVAIAACGDDTGGPVDPISDAGGVAVCVPLGEAPTKFPRDTPLIVPDEVIAGAADGRQDAGDILAPADACDRAEYFIEVAAGAPTPCEAFPRAVEEALAASLEGSLCALLGDEVESGEARLRGQKKRPDAQAFDPGRFCALACTDAADETARAWRKRETAAFNVTLVPVFEPGDGLPLPPGAERRFFRVRVDASLGGAPEPITIPHASVCSFVEELRAAVAAGQAACEGQATEPVCASPAGEPIRVGRECVVLGSGLTATAEMLDWHRRRVGLDAVETPAAAGARVAVIDSGAESGLGGFPRLLPDGTADVSAPTHPHGSLLTALILQAHQGAALASVRALGTDGAGAGTGTTAELARAIWQALAHPELQDDPARPLLMNLSVGWPEALSRPRRVRGIRRTVDPDTGLWGYREGEPICDTIEDGPGEAVRYALAAAYHAAPLRADAPVVAFAAAGNRTHALRAEADGLAAALGHVDCAGPDIPDAVASAWCADGLPIPDAPLFLPALWGHRGVAENPWAPEVCLPPTRIVEPVSALDELDRPAAADVAALGAPLAAPGERVYATHPGLSTTLQEVGGKCDSAALRRRKQPLALTGTSVSAALTTGLASAVLATEDGAARPRTARGLSRFLYVTGLPVGALDGVSASRESLDGIPVRRPNACRARRAAEAPCGAEIAACADAAPDDGPALGQPDELGACVEVAEACLAQTAGCPAPAVAASAIPAGYPPAGGPASSCFRSSFSGSSASIWRRTETVGVAGELPLSAAATVGPQPPIPVCPDCLFAYDAGARKVTLTVDVNTKLPTGTVISSPRVVVYDTRFPGTPAGSQTISLTNTTFTMSPAVDPSKWKAGTRIVISGPAPVGTGQITASAADWRKFVKAELLCNVSGSTLITSPIDVSTLRVTVP